MESVIPKRRHKSPKASFWTLSGFTLLEVLLSVAIFLLLVGGIFAAVSAATSASTQIALNQLETERFDSLQRFLRQVFLNLPGDARLELKTRPTGGSGNVIELQISPAPEFTDFSQNSLLAGGLCIAAIPDSKGNFRLCVTNFDSELPLSERDKQLSNATWIAMLSDVREIRWRFAGIDNPGLQETWQTSNGRPGLANFELTMSDGSTKEWQFFIPVVQPVKAEKRATSK